MQLRRVSWVPWEESVVAGTVATIRSVKSISMPNGSWAPAPRGPGGWHGTGDGCRRGLATVISEYRLAVRLPRPAGLAGPEPFSGLAGYARDQIVNERNPPSGRCQSSAHASASTGDSASLPRYCGSPSATRVAPSPNSPRSPPDPCGSAGETGWSRRSCSRRPPRTRSATSAPPKTPWIGGRRRTVPLAQHRQDPHAQPVRQARHAPPGRGRRPRPRPGPPRPGRRPEHEMTGAGEIPHGTRGHESHQWCDDQSPWLSRDWNLIRFTGAFGSAHVAERFRLR